MYRALYRKWRPVTFDDVVGQEHITSILKYQCKEGKHSHAYLFCGTRGTGKTTCSKILAKALNCLSPVDGNPCGKCEACIAIDSGSCMDVVEMDAASNNGIDDIRDIRDEVVYTPSQLKYKVYIIDEVHMLSINAFNGLLKTLEEPPSYVVFILATTEMHKLPTTIISRCQRYDFRKMSSDDIIGRLKYIAENEGFEITDDAARLISRLASGGMRDAISLFELCSGASKKIDVELVSDMLGVSGTQTLSDVVRAVKEKDYAKIFGIIRDIENSSKDIGVFWQELISFYRDMLVAKTLKDCSSYLEMSDSELSLLRSLVADMTSAEIIRQSKILDAALSSLEKAGSYKRNVAELTLIRMCDSSLDSSFDSLLSRINELEGHVMRLSSMINNINHSSDISVSSIVQNKESDKPEIAQVDTIDTVLEARQIPKKEVAPEPEFIPKNTEATRQVLKYWDDIVEKVRGAIPSVKGFIDDSEAYKSDDGDYVVVVNSEISVKMLSREKARNTIADAISFYEKMRVSDAQLVFIFDTNLKKNDSPIDELL